MKSKYRVLEYNDGYGTRYRPQVKGLFGWRNMRIGYYTSKEDAEQFIRDSLSPDRYHEVKEI